MKLITEINENISYEVLNEGTGAKKSYFITGPFLQAEVKNRNGRIYEMNTLKPEVDRYISDYVNKNRAFGELGHPDGPSINLDRVSHLIVSLKEDGNNFVGKAKLLDTPMGKIAQNLLEGGAQLGVSSRGVGSLQETNKGAVVKDDFRLSTAADIVADPSAPDAWVNGIMEGKEWIWENGLMKEVHINNFRQIISKATKINLQEKKIEAFKQFLSKL